LASGRWGPGALIMKIFSLPKFATQSPRAALSEAAD